MRRWTIGAVAAGAALLAGGALAVGAQPRGAGRIVVRVNQVGYETTGHKRAYVLSTAPTGRVRFTVVSANGTVALTTRSTRSCAGWNRRWRGCQILDFSRLRAPGRYRIGVGRLRSPTFQIASGAELYGPLSTRAVQFLQAQRDGSQVIPGVVPRKAAHLADAAAAAYAIPRYRHGLLAGTLRASGTTVDLAGGWFDAGDYLKFSGTASFTDLILLFTLREYGSRLPAPLPLVAEAHFGTDWLLKTWDERRKVLYEQVGLGDGNGNSVLGDHDIWRLPQRDDSYRARPLRYIAHRPVFAANRPGAPVSPNLAGREAAAFALCAQVFRLSDPGYAHRCLLAGQTLYDAAARSWHGRLAGSVPAAYYVYPEWRDDMELAATELYLATLYIRSADLPHREPYDFLEAASRWANGYQASARGGQDSLNLYDVAPLADYDLYRAMVASGNTTDLYTNASDVIGDMRDELRLGAHLTRSGPLGLADPATPEDTVAHALGYAAEARLYAAVGGRRTYESFAEQQLDWVLGANPWGSSFVVGAGSVFPHCLAHQVANLSGSLNGDAPILAGAVVEGPTGAGSLGSLGAPDGYRRCTAGRTTFASFDGRGFRYLDDVRSSSTSEPADDITSLSLLAFAQEAAGLPRAARLTIPQ
jgi:endoglucanase